jgi:small subunit ribosomal protein S8
MTMTDPIADMLTRLRNANSAKLMSTSMPYSKFKANIAKILKEEGYIKNYTSKDLKVGKELTIELKYSSSNERAIEGIKKISKPGLRKYASSADLPKVLGGLGVAIVSTSSGLMTDKQARVKGIGGEVVAFIW